ncbi:endonuclease/exonuclease/phosphatase family protein [Desulfosarcina sp.]|nr:endonuclease/exonuclease/phosphatase family protein [Desulfosarcina sp.]
MGRLVRVNSASTPLAEEAGIKVLSYNVQNFFHVNVSSTKYIDDFTNENSIIEFINSQDADIICLQEMFYDRGDLKSFPKKLGKTLDCPNYYYENYYSTVTKKIDAIATFTKYEIINNGHLQFDEKSIGIFNDLIIHGDTVRLYNLHLASIHLQRDDYDFMSDIASNKENENFKTKSRNILNKLQTAFIKRGRQADIVSEHISQSKYPVIICGDLNDTPFSYTYEEISGNLTDAFIKSGSGLGETYAGDDFPSLRIDYIFHDKQFTSSEFSRHKVFLSDHFPVSSVLYKISE